jgi:uncharacterized peroxidase-related enzyme
MCLVQSRTPTKEDIMTRIAALTIDQATPAAQTLLTGAKAKLGMVPNLFSTLAHSPAALAGYLQLNDALQQGALSAKDREIVSIAAAQFNGCGYCLSAHTLMGKGAGLPADAIAAARQGQGSAVAALTHQVLRARGQISDGELAAARDAGLSDAQITEVVAAVALNVLTNYFNNLELSQSWRVLIFLWIIMIKNVNGELLSWQKTFLFIIKTIR